MNSPTLQLSIWFHGHFQGELRSFYVEIYFLSILFNTLWTRDYSAVSLEGIFITDIIVSIGLVASVRNSLVGAGTALRVGMWSLLLLLRQQITPFPAGEGQCRVLWTVSVTWYSYSSSTLWLSEHTGPRRNTGGSQKTGRDNRYSSRTAKS